MKYKQVYTWCEVMSDCTQLASYDYKCFEKWRILVPARDRTDVVILVSSVFFEEDERR